MEILNQDAPVLPEIPRFSDGTINILELVRALAETAINEIMDVQAEEACEQGN